jgi:nucleotide-binding universal stress UspA family protein
MYTHILVALDGSETASHALDAALQLARESNAQLQPLYVIDVPTIAFDAPGFDPSIVRDAFVEESKRVLADARERMEKHGVAGTTRVVEVTPPGEDIAQRVLLAARDAHTDLIVLGTHGRRGFRRLVLGSVAERVLRSATLPVLIIPARASAAGVGGTAASSVEKELS